MHNESTEKILKAVERTRERAKQAENEFDRVAEHIQKMASRSINLFGGTAVSQVSDIAARSRKACDDLYVAYQSLIMSLDSTCRPLVTNDVDSSAAKEVFELIKWLNEESEIENNFTASLNGSSLGNVASKRYIPSIECKMVQNFWEDKYLAMPGVAEEIERKRKEAENARKSKEDSKQRDVEDYKNKLRLWGEECDKIEQIRKEMLNEKVLAEKERVETITFQNHKSRVGDLHKEIDETNNTISNATNVLDSLGFFALGEKLNQKRIIKQGKITLETLKEKVNYLEKVYSDNQKKDKNYISDFKKKLKKEIEKDYPLPIKPEQPLSTMSPTQIVDKHLENEIVEFMSLAPNKLYTINGLSEECKGLYDLSLSKVASLVAHICDEGKIQRTLRNGRAYYKLVR